MAAICETILHKKRIASVKWAIGKSLKFEVEFSG